MCWPSSTRPSIGSARVARSVRADACYTQAPPVSPRRGLTIRRAPPPKGLVDGRHLPQVPRRSPGHAGRKAFDLDVFSALGGTRTPNLLIRSQMLYPLSYERRWPVVLP